VVDSGKAVLGLRRIFGLKFERDVFIDVVLRLISSDLEMWGTRRSLLG
jgi:hypothetical protein